MGKIANGSEVVQEVQHLSCAESMIWLKIDDVRSQLVPGQHDALQINA